MRLADTTFVNLRYALVDLTRLVNVTRPVAPKLQQLLVQLRPLAIDAVPTVRDLSNIISRPGPNNDLIELNKLAVPLAKATVGKVFADGKVRRGAFPVSQQALTRVRAGAGRGPPLRRRSDRMVRGLLAPGRRRTPTGSASRIAPVVGLGSIATGPTGVRLNFCTR